MTDDPRGRLAAYIDQLDRLTRRPGEPPLREQVAAAARAELARLDRPQSITGGSGVLDQPRCTPSSLSGCRGDTRHVPGCRFAALAVPGACTGGADCPALTHGHGCGALSAAGER